MQKSTLASAEISRRTLLKAGVGGSLALGAAQLLSACGSGGGQGGPSGASKGTANYANKNLDFFFYTVLVEALQRSYKEHGYAFETTDAKGDASTQYDQINSTLLKKPAFLITNPIDTENLIPLTTRAKSMQVPVGVIDTPLSGGDASITIAFNNKMGGQLAGERTLEELKAKYGTPKGKVLNLYGALSATVWRDRKDGFEGAFADYPDVQLISRPTETLQENARSVAGATLSQYPDLDAIHGPTDSLTLAVLPAMKSANRLKPVGDDAHIILTSIDGDPIAIQWLKDKTLDASISQDPVAYAQVCVELLDKYSVKGQPIPLGAYSNDKYIWKKAPVVESKGGPRMVLPPYFITLETADDPRQWANIVTNDWGMKET
jgi:simple sugar transport system substrate-binding protein